MTNRYYRVLVILLSLGLISACSTAAGNKRPPSEGLVEVDDWNVDQVWVKPGFVPDSYSSIMINGRGVEFRSVKDSNTPYNRSTSAYPISIPDREKLKKIVIEEFSAELKAVEGYLFSDTPGQRTLSLDVKIVDVVSNVPSSTPVQTTVYLTEVGRATLMLTFRDSMTGEVLVSVVDRRSAESYTGLGFTESTPANNWAAVRKLAQHWAIGLRRGLDEMKSS